MEDPDDVEATDGARWCLQETSEPPTIFGYFYRSDVIKDTCLHLHCGCICAASCALEVHKIGLQQMLMVEPRFSGPGWAGTDRGS